MSAASLQGQQDTGTQNLAPLNRVATLVANPAKANLTPTLAETCCDILGAKNLYWLADGVACDIAIPDHAPIEPALQTVRTLLARNRIDLAVQNSESRRKKALIADMDSTMIEQECIDELAAEVGLKDQVSKITARAMNGEIEFEPALRERVHLLKGLPVSTIESVIENRITLMPGGAHLVQTMKANGGYCALVSGGFTAFTSRIATLLGFDENRANTLIKNGDTLTGEVKEPILGQQAKVDALLEIAAVKDLQPEDFIAVGDGANDLGMLKLAGTGVALHAKPKVAEQAKIRIDNGDLTALLYLQGYRKSDFIN